MNFLAHNPKQFRGYTEVNRVVHERIAENNGFELGQFLGERLTEPNATGLLQLLGTYLNGDISAEYRNGDPNSLNMILWYVLFNGLAKGIADHLFLDSSPNGDGADKPNQLKLKTEFLAALEPLKAGSQGQAFSQPNLESYWLAVMRYDAPESEFLNWAEFVTTSATFKNASPRDAIQNMTLAILYNPYFLLGVS